MAAPLAGPAPVVLVVDDEPIVLHFMERVLTSAGYRVLAASNAWLALELARREPGLALLVTDIRMAPIDGHELARRVREALPTTKILFVSGYASDPDNRFLDAPLLKKPFLPAQLVVAVGELLTTNQPSCEPAVPPAPTLGEFLPTARIARDPGHSQSA
jgi:CheY-like chemotaxis protein